MRTATTTMPPSIDDDDDDDDGSGGGDDDGSDSGGTKGGKKKGGKKKGGKKGRVAGGVGGCRQNSWWRDCRPRVAERGSADFPSLSKPSTEHDELDPGSRSAWVSVDTGGESPLVSTGGAD